MKRHAALIAVLGFLLPLNLLGQAQQPPLSETVTTAIPGVVEAGTVVEVIGDGFEGTEGPVGLPDGSLIFTETNASRITRFDADGNTSTFLENTNGSNGLGFDAEGRLISVQTVPGSTQIGVIHPPGAERVLVDNYAGKPFGRPNDLVVAKNGGVYFTEPGAGGPPQANALPPTVYYIPPGATAPIHIAEGIGFPNGIMLSPDERVLYVNDARGAHIVAFDVQPDGTVRNRWNFARYDALEPTDTGEYNSRADGLAVDTEGRLYSAMPDGVQVFSPQGEHLGTVPTSRRVQNLAFAGPDKRTLYMVGSGAAWKVRLLAQGYTGRAK